MELFHECKNKYFYMVSKIINMAAEGLYKDEIIKIIENEEYDEKLIGKDFQTFEDIILNTNAENSLNLLTEENDKFYSVLHKEKQLPLKIRFTALEKQWLKSFISIKDVQKLLGQEIIQKLNKALEDVESYEDTIDFTNKNQRSFEYDLKQFNTVFFTIINAMKDNKCIKYTNITADGTIYKDKTAVPLRIEYSLKDDTFRASIFSIEDKRHILINLHTIAAVDIIDYKYNLDRKQLLENMKNEKYCEEPVTIIVEDKRGAMERCFMSFSSFERNSHMIDVNKYEMDIFYYSFQEYDVISKIIALGPYVTVKSPEKIRKIIIERIKKALS